MKNFHLFLNVFVLIVPVLIHLYRSGANLSCHDVTQGDLSVSSGCHSRDKSRRFFFFFNFFIYLLTILVVSLVSVVSFLGFVSLVPVVSFRCFGF